MTRWCHDTDAEKALPWRRSCQRAGYAESGKEGQTHLLLYVCASLTGNSLSAMLCGPPVAVRLWHLIQEKAEKLEALYDSNI